MHGPSCTIEFAGSEPKRSVICLIAFVTTPSSVPSRPECPSPMAGVCGHSYRAEKGKADRMLALLALDQTIGN
jgi:hypothetical protein